MINWMSSKQLQIIKDGVAISNADIERESLQIVELLCSEKTLRFGRCESSTLKVRIRTQEQYKGARITVKVMQGSDEYQLGTYKVYSDKLTANRCYRDIVAYDAMYDIIHTEVSGWYNSILPDASSTVTLKEFRDSFFSYFGIAQESVTLPNDSMTVTKTIDAASISGKTVITSICELNGCFGHISRNGIFQYVFLREVIPGTYPSATLYPADDLYPKDDENVQIFKNNQYMKAQYEDYVVEKITKLQLRNEDNDIGCIYGTGDNCYIVQNNFLLYGKGNSDLTVIAENLYSVISTVTYRPATIEAMGNPYLLVGDGIKLITQQGVIYSYILQRTLKGIQSVKDVYQAAGEQFQTEKVNSVRESIIQLQGKTNRLIRTVDETISRIESVNESLSSEIKQTAEQISTKVSKGSVISEINQTAETIKISASKIDLAGYVTINDLSGAGTTSINGANIQTGTIRADSISNIGVLTVSNITCGSSFDCTNSSGTAEASFDKVSARSMYSNSANFNFYNNNLVGLCSFSFVDANGTTHDVSFIGTHSESVG